MLCLAFCSDEVTPISSFIPPQHAAMWDSFALRVLLSAIYLYGYQTNY